MSLLRSRYIHPLRQNTHSTALVQFLIQDYYHRITHIYHPDTGAKETYNSLRAQYPVKWETSFSNDIGRLAQGVGNHMKNGNENIFLITRNQVPNEKKNIYANTVCN